MEQFHNMDVVMQIPMNSGKPLGADSELSDQSFTCKYQSLAFKVYWDLLQTGGKLKLDLQAMYEEMN